MSALDIIRRSIIEEFSTSLNFGSIFLSLVTAFIIGLYIVYIYKKTFAGVHFSKQFTMMVILVAMVTALIIRTISSNLALSLGLVGALSIVRFRTAVKEPIDTAFIFWAVSAGIMSGVGVYTVAVLSSVALGALFVLSTLLGFKQAQHYLLLIKCDMRAYEAIHRAIGKLKKSKLRSKQIIGSKVDVTYEIAIGQKDDITYTLAKVEGVESVSIITYKDEFGL
ncbi:MAG: DUF4956 domain-containing protein [Erysipelothrix sp.]|jgi:hypothetical protein|nr:DUF4956 domain-containing protein [Erysipelothrix sp.]